MCEIECIRENVFHKFSVENLQQRRKAMKTKRSTNWIGMQSILFMIISGLMAINVGAVEPLKEAFSLWLNDDSLIDLRFVGFDFDSSTAEIELIGGGEGEETVLPPVSGNVSAHLSEKISVHSADGTSLIFAFPTIGLTSSTYPDPGDSANQQGGSNETFYGGDFCCFNIPMGTPAADARQTVIDRAEFPIGFGVANSSGGARTFIFGLGFGLEYSNITESNGNASKYKFESYDVATLTMLCSRQFLGLSNGWLLEEPATSSVGNYLSGTRANDDEIRVLRAKEKPWGFLQQIIYIDPRTCADISVVHVARPN